MGAPREFMFRVMRWSYPFRIISLLISLTCLLLPPGASCRWRSRCPELVSGSSGPAGENSGIALCSALVVCSSRCVRPHLVLPQLSGHVLLGSLQSILQVSGSGFGFFHSQFSALLRFSQLVLQVGTLRKEWGEYWSGRELFKSSPVSW